MKKIIEFLFKKINYYFYTPKLDTYGGFINDLIQIEKIRQYKRSKSIMCLVYNPFHSKFKKNISIFIPSKKILFSIIKNLDFFEKILSIFFSLILNIFIFINKFIFLGKFKKFFLFELGYNARTSGNFEYLQITQKDNLGIKKINCEYLNLKKTRKLDNYITLCIKDNNYQKLKPIITTETAANVNDYLSSIKYLNKKYVILRIGDPTMNKIDYKNKKFHNLINVDNHFEMQFDSCFKSKFYFGTSGSHAYIPCLTNTRRYMSNCTDFHGLQATFEYSSFLIFKKVYDIKQKKILSLEEIYLKNHVFDLIDHNKKKNYLYIDNTENENLLLAKEINYHKKISISKQLREFNEIRLKYMKNKINKKKIEKSENFIFLKNAYCNIPTWYLDTYLYPNKNLTELSKKFQKKNAKNF